MSSNDNHFTSFIANVKVMYLVSIDDRAIIVYFLEHQLTGLPSSIRMKSEVDLWLFLSPAQ